MYTRIAIAMSAHCTDKKIAASKQPIKHIAYDYAYSYTTCSTLFTNGLTLAQTDVLLSNKNTF